MNSRQVQYAILLSQVRSFSQLAEQLGISQPALSKQILNLEAELDIKLFDRNHMPLSLTPAGEYFIRRAQEMLYQEDQLRKSLDQFRSGQKGRLVIGVTPFRSFYLMPDIVKQMKEQFPGVQIVLHEENSLHLRTAVAEGKFDFAVVNLPVDESVLEVVPLEPDTLVLAVPKSLTHLLPQKDTRSIEFPDAAALPFVVVGQTQEMRQLFDKLCAKADFEPNIAAETVSITTAWAMTSAGVGATLLPLQFVRKNHFSQELVLYEIPDITYSRQPAIVTKRGQYISEYTRYAMELLQQSR